MNYINIAILIVLLIYVTSHICDLLDSVSYLMKSKAKEHKMKAYELYLNNQFLLMKQSDELYNISKTEIPDLDKEMKKLHFTKELMDFIYETIDGELDRLIYRYAATKSKYDMLKLDVDARDICESIKKAILLKVQEEKISVDIGYLMKTVATYTVYKLTIAVKKYNDMIIVKN